MDYTTLPERIDAYLSKHATKDSYHWQGRSVIMPSGSGKSYYVESVQKKVEWLDADPIMWAVGALTLTQQATALSCLLYTSPSPRD